LQSDEEKMKKFILIDTLIGILIVLLPPVINAEPNFWGGFGHMPCRDFFALKKLDRLEDPEGPVLTYVTGVLAGVNIVRLQQKIGQAIDIPDRKDLSIIIEGICYKDPSRKIGMVATEIAYNLVIQGKTFNPRK
jgi:hypothetical protein